MSDWSARVDSVFDLGDLAELTLTVIGVVALACAGIAALVGLPWPIAAVIGAIVASVAGVVAWLRVQSRGESLLPD